MMVFSLGQVCRFLDSKNRAKDTSQGKSVLRMNQMPAYSGCQARYLLLEFAILSCLSSPGVFLGSRGGLPNSMSLSPVVETDRLIVFKSVYEACCSCTGSGQGNLSALQV